jgi:hypothetical protein
LNFYSQARDIRAPLFYNYDILDFACFFVFFASFIYCVIAYFFPSLRAACGEAIQIVAFYILQIDMRPFRHCEEGV